MTGQVSEAKSTTVVRRYGILTICPPFPLGGAQGGKLTNIAHLLVMTIDLTSETWCELANSAPGHHAVLYRSGICAVLAEISHTNVGTSHLGPTRVGPKRPKSAPKIVPRGGQVGCRPTPVACACTPRTPRLGCALSWALARALIAFKCDFAYRYSFRKQKGI